jgi:hypothetical protein
LIVDVAEEPVVVGVALWPPRAQPTATLTSSAPPDTAAAQ